MTSHPPALDLHGIADHLAIRFFRVRQWNERGRLPAPDICDIPRKRLWSPSLIEAWAATRNLWPPGADQFECPECHGTFCVYETGALNLHTAGGDTCPGSGRIPVRADSAVHA